jgi:hypothetical protein
MPEMTEATILVQPTLMLENRAKIGFADGSDRRYGRTASDAAYRIQRRQGERPPDRRLQTEQRAVLEQSRGSVVNH